VLVPAVGVRVLFWGRWGLDSLEGLDIGLGWTVSFVQVSFKLTDKG